MQPTPPGYDGQSRKTPASTLVLVKRALEGGVTDDEAAKHFKLPIEVIRNYRDAWRVSSDTSQRLKKSNSPQGRPAKRLPASTLRILKQALKAGARITECAKHFKLSASTVNRYRKAWKIPGKKSPKSK